MSGSVFYVGTYAKEGGTIFRFRLGENGEFDLIGRYDGGPKPSYFAFDKKRGFLFVTNEVETEGTKGHGTVRSFGIDPESGRFELKRVSDSRGKLPVSVRFLEEAGAISVSNYNSGTIALFSVKEDGGLEFKNETGPSIEDSTNPEEPIQPHAHQSIPAPDGRFLFVIDKGLNQIRGYPLTAGEVQVDNGYVAFQASLESGPRQMVYHPDKKHAYLVHELKSELSALSYDAESGTFEELRRLPTIPEDFNEGNKCGGISISPDGRHLYVSNRGHNSIAVFNIDEESGIPEPRSNRDVEGEWPREFAADPQQRFLVVANQRSDTLTSFAVDSETGELSFTGFRAEIEKPVFVGFW